MEKLTLAMKIEIVLILVIQHKERQAKKNTDIDQSQKVEQTNNVTYYPQYTNNLIHQVHIKNCQHTIQYEK